MSARSEKALVQAGAAWVRRERERLGWSPAKLATRTRMMQRCQGRRGPLPGSPEIIALEGGELRQLPRWLTLVADVFAFEEVAPEWRAAWIARRNWYDAGHPVDLSEILVFRDEAMLLDVLVGMDEGDRRAWRAVVTKWPMRGGRERDRVEAAQEWLRRMNIPMMALTGEEEDLVARFRRLPAAKRSEMSDAVAHHLPWPPPPPIALDDAEMDLVHGYVSADADGRFLLHALATDARLRTTVIDLVRRTSGKQASPLEPPPSNDPASTMAPDRDDAS